jgi:hypothetical protein
VCGAGDYVSRSHAPLAQVLLCTSCCLCALPCCSCCLTKRQPVCWCVRLFLLSLGSSCSGGNTHKQVGEPQAPVLRIVVVVGCSGVWFICSLMCGGVVCFRSGVAYSQRPAVHVCGSF